MINLVWLASWYPNTTSPFDGDFIERHAVAVSAVARLTVILVVKDDTMPPNSLKVEKTVNGNMVVYRGYYGPSSFFKPLEKIISFRKYRSIQNKLYQQAVTEQGVPDLIHVHVAMKAGMLALRLKKKTAIPFVVTEHWSGYYKNCQPNVYSGNWLLNRLNKKVLQQCKLLITVSEHLGKTINQNFTPVPFKVIPNVVDTGLFFYQSYSPKRFRFIHPSGLIPVKNPEGIIAACKLVKERGYDFELQVLGPPNEALQALTQAEGLLDNTVFFGGEVSYATVAQQMQQSSALLLFSRHENMSCVVLEALCCGLPVICTRVGGLPEVVTEANGILVASEAIEELATAMCRMIDTYPQYQRQQIAATAMQKFNYKTVAQQHLEIYEAVIASKE